MTDETNQQSGQQESSSSNSGAQNQTPPTELAAKTAPAFDFAELAAQNVATVAAMMEAPENVAHAVVALQGQIAEVQKIVGSPAIQALVTEGEKVMTMVPQSWVAKMEAFLQHGEQALGFKAMSSGAAQTTPATKTE